MGVTTKRTVLLLCTSALCTCKWSNPTNNKSVGVLRLRRACWLRDWSVIGFLLDFD